MSVVHFKFCTRRGGKITFKEFQGEGQSYLTLLTTCISRRGGEGLARGEEKCPLPPPPPRYIPACKIQKCIQLCTTHCTYMYMYMKVQRAHLPSQPRGSHPSAYNLPVQKVEPLRCLALRTRTCRFKSSFVPWELSLPTLVAHGHGQ